MELSKTIKRLRTEKGWSQETLAEKAYVSRQTISNWETEKNYPDVHSLLILSDLFGGLGSGLFGRGFLGGGSGAVAAGGQSEDHAQSKKQGKNLFHSYPPNKFFRIS